MKLLHHTQILTLRRKTRVGIKPPMARINHGTGITETDATIETKVAGISIQGGAMTKVSVEAIIDVRRRVNGLLRIPVHKVTDPDPAVK